MKARESIANGESMTLESSFQEAIPQASDGTVRLLMFRP
jgi:hypothetical protein